MDRLEDTMTKVMNYKKAIDAIKNRENEERARKLTEIRNRINELIPRTMKLYSMAIMMQDAGDKGINEYFSTARGIYFGKYGRCGGIICSDKPYMGDKGVIFAIVAQRTALSEYCTYNEYDYIKDANIFIERYERFEKDVLDHINKVVRK